MTNTQIKINSVDKSSLILWQSLRKTEILTKEPDTLEFDLFNHAGQTYVPAVGDQVDLYDNTQDIPLIFSGLIVEVDSANAGLLNTISVICKDWTHTADQRLVAQSYENKTATEIIEDIFTNYTTGFTTSNVDAPVTIDKITFNYLSVAQCMQQIIQAIGAGYDWYIDYTKDVHFFQTGTKIAPFSLDDVSGNFVFSSLTSKIDTSQLRNKIIVRGGEITGDAVTNNQISDGIQIVFFVGYNLSSFLAYDGPASPASHTVTITVANPAVITWTAHGMNNGDIVKFSTTGALPTGITAGVEYYVVNKNTDDFQIAATPGGAAIATTGSQSGTHTATRKFIVLTVGIDGVSDPTAYDALYNSDLGLLKFPTARTSGDTIRTTGIPSFPIITTIQNDVSIGLYGKFEYIVIDKTITTRAAARNRALAELLLYGLPITTGSFETRTKGLVAGQTIDIDSVIQGISGTFKIQQIETTVYEPANGNLYYTVDFVSTISVSMIDILNRLLITDPSTQIQVSPNEIVDTVYSVTENINIEEAIDITTTTPVEETITIGESVTVQALDYAVIFVAGPITPTSTKRQFILNGSLLG